MEMETETETETETNRKKRGDERQRRGMRTERKAGKQSDRERKRENPV